MKALTVLQPWASLIALGAKRIETRSWHTSYRGPLAIHAGKAFGAWSQEHWAVSAIRAALCEGGIARAEDLPRGCIIAVCRLAACRPIVEPPPEPERGFGVFAAGRFAWSLEVVRPLAHPIPARGRLGLWDWTPESAEAVAAWR